jgi:hypothetical protein
MFAIVPNEVSDAINKILDREIQKYPDAHVDRDIFYNACLEYYDDTGEIPEIELVPKGE